MFSPRKRGIRRGLLLLAIGFVGAGGAYAQPSAGADLRGNLAALSANPRSVTALVGAGRAALAMDDADGALRYFSRAADIEPDNARAKAGMAQALVRLERASEALPLFTEAARLGAPEVELAADRGLAWDSLGFPARAQADYLLSLRRGDDAEVRRRLALSLAISGRRDEALRTIGAQLAANDPAALRTQAFILALTGDAAGGGRIARGAMPDGGDEMASFLARLSSLSPSQKALAVHFGHFPRDGRAEPFVQADVGADPAALAFAQGSQPAGLPGVRRRPDSVASQIRPAPRYPAAAQPRYAALEPRRIEMAAQSQGQAPPWPDPVPDPRQQQGQSQPQYQPPQYRPPPPRQAPAWADPEPDPRRSPGFDLVPQGRPLGTRAAPAPARTQPQAPASDFSSVTSFVNSLPPEDDVVAPPVSIAPAATRRVRTTIVPNPVQGRTTRSARARPTPPPAPARTWVQLATGSSRAALSFTYGTFRRRAPTLLGSRAAYATEGSGADRLLVGPFASDGAAGAFVSQLRARGIQAHSWTSAAGQEIGPLQGGSDDTRSTRTNNARQEQPAARGGSRHGRGQQQADTGRATRSGGTRSATTRSGGTSSTRGAARNATSTRAPTGTHGSTRSGRSSASTRAQQPAAKPKPVTAGASRSRSQPQSRPASRGRRSH